MTAEILAVAAAHVARDGAAAISLRSIARDLGMAPSALYRYFDGRDALLSALILSAYEALADEAERAADEADRPGGRRGRPSRALAGRAARPAAVGPRASAPVGPHLRHAGPRATSAPEDTVEPYARMALALVRPLFDGARGGTASARTRATTSITDELRDAVDPVTRGALPRSAGRDGGAASWRR